MNDSALRSTPIITYFNIRGRLEPVRLIFEELGIDYEDRRISDGVEWQALKATLPFGALPTCQEGDLYIVQSQAIYRHLARVLGLYGKDEDERVQCDIVGEAIADAKEQLWRFFWEREQEQKAAAFASGELHHTLANLQKWYLRNGDDVEFWVGGSLTFVDFFAFTYLDEIRAFFPDMLGMFPALQAFRIRIAKRPRIAEYLASGRRPVGFGYGVRGMKNDPEAAT